MGRTYTEPAERCGTVLTFVLALLICGFRGAAQPLAVEEHHLTDMPTDPTFHASLPWMDLVEARGSASRALLQQQDKHADPKRQGGGGGGGSHCRLTRGNWCGPWERQTPVASKPPPRGDKECPKACNGVGNCNYDTGICDCPAGWTGEDCATVLKRPCTHRYRRNGFIPEDHTDVNGRDKDWLEEGWRASRCSGICDVALGMCYCDNPTYGHIPAPAGSPPGTRPIQYGRMLGDHCKATTTWDGKPTKWGNEPYDKLYGEHGWCNATVPKSVCGCYLDGHYGINCDIESEHVCPNQCGARGVCYLGFCKCYEGWYGTDCSRRRAGQPVELNDIANGKRPWLAAVSSEAPAAMDPPAQPTRKRPFIFIYDLPPEFNARMLQWRGNRQSCMYRLYSQENDSRTTENVYALEWLLHETLIQSEYRTFDPEEADFFYVPIYVNCFIHPVFAWADVPWYYGPIEMRPLQAANFMIEAQNWIRKAYPWWDRRQGRDHIWLALHDEGACWMPSEIYNTSIVLTHWGRQDLIHTSNTAYDWDNYSRPMQHDEWQPKDWRGIFAGHPCYTPGKDLVIPSFKSPEHYSHSPLMGAPWKKRDILMFFRGDCGNGRLAWYSRQIRQILHAAAKKFNWVDKYKILIGTPNEEHMKGSYGELLSRSKFALVAPGDGWSGRAEDAILHGCIPVVIMDNVHAVYESILDWDSFSVRVNERSLLHLPQILLAIPDDKVARMQRRIARVWSRFAWATGTYTAGLHAHWHARVLSDTSDKPTAMTKTEGVRAVKEPWPAQEDAFHTIMSWLYSRIADTR